MGFEAGIPICPGRLLSKNVILHTCAYLIENFDIEILTPELEISNWRYGLGVGRPAHDIAARIRKRKVVRSNEDANGHLV